MQKPSRHKPLGNRLFLCRKLWGAEALSRSFFLFFCSPSFWAKMLLGINLFVSCYEQASWGRGGAAMLYCHSGMLRSSLNKRARFDLPPLLFIEGGLDGLSDAFNGPGGFAHIEGRLGLLHSPAQDQTKNNRPQNPPKKRRT